MKYTSGRVLEDIKACCINTVFDEGTCTGHDARLEARLEVTLLFLRSI